MKKEKRFEVHDEDGVIRWFHTLEEAHKFASGDRNNTIVVEIIEHKAPPKFDISTLPDAPF